jgi:hypothetical protein
MRQFNLLRWFKRKKSLATQSHYRSQRSPFKSGYHFAFLLTASLLLATCGLNRSLAVPLIISLTPPPEIRVASNPQTRAPETGVPAVASQTAKAVQPAKPKASITTPMVSGLISPSSSLPPTASQPPATSTPGVFATSDLLFISDNRLLRWDHVTHYSSSLAENVVAFSTNDNGSMIVLLRPRSMAANGIELFDLDLLDFTSKQTRHLIEGTARLLDLALSPDGAWLAYRQSPEGKPAIRLLHLSDPTSPANLGKCEATGSDSCTPIAWSPDSRNLLWSDPSGLWIAAAGKMPASVLHTSRVDVPDPQGKTSQIEARFSSPEWSPVGRFVLVQVVPNQSDASWHAVIDSLTGKLAQVLDSYKLAPDQISVSWLPDGRLAVARSSDPAQQTPATIQVWDVLATNPDLLVSTGIYKLPSGNLPSEATPLTISDSSNTRLRLDWIQQAHPGHLLFGTVQPESPSETRLYDLNLLIKSFTQLTQLKSEVQEVLWAPDGSGMLIINANGQALFVSSDGKETTDLELSLDPPPTGFVWLPPSLRK